MNAETVPACVHVCVCAWVHVCLEHLCQRAHGVCARTYMRALLWLHRINQHSTSCPKSLLVRHLLVCLPHEIHVVATSLTGKLKFNLQDLYLSLYLHIYICIYIYICIHTRMYMHIESIIYIYR